MPILLDDVDACIREDRFATPMKCDHQLKVDLFVDLRSPLLSSSACRREGKRARCSGCHSILGRPLRRSRQQPQSPRAQKQKKERQRLHVSGVPCVCIRTLTGASQGSSGRSRQGPPWPGPGPPSPAPGPPASPSHKRLLAIEELHLEFGRRFKHNSAY